MNWRFYLSYYSVLAVISFFAIQWAISLPTPIPNIAQNVGKDVSQLDGNYGLVRYTMSWQNVAITYDISTIGNSCIITIPSENFEWMSILGPDSPSRFNSTTLSLARGAALDPICREALKSVDALPMR